MNNGEVFVHELGLCESKEVGNGTRVWAFAHVMDGAKVGTDCNIGDHAFIENGAIVGNCVTIKNAVLIWDKVTIEDHVFVGPSVSFTNDLDPRVEFKKEQHDFTPTLVRRGASIGAQSTIVCGVTIGPYAMVGAGSVVVDDVLAHELVVGNPARRIGWACRCGRRLLEGFICSCGRRYQATDDGLECLSE